jgi:hypothetical protein
MMLPENRFTLFGIMRTWVALLIAGPADRQAQVAYHLARQSCGEPVSTSPGLRAENETAALWAPPSV